MRPCQLCGKPTCGPHYDEQMSELKRKLAAASDSNRINRLVEEGKSWFLRRYDSETDDDLKPFLEAFAQAYCYSPNTTKVLDPELGKAVALLCLRAAREATR